MKGVGRLSVKKKSPNYLLKDGFLVFLFLIFVFTVSTSSLFMTTSYHISCGILKAGKVHRRNTTGCD